MLPSINPHSRALIGLVVDLFAGGGTFEELADGTAIVWGQAVSLRELSSRQSLASLRALRVATAITQNKVYSYACCLYP